MVARPGGWSRPGAKEGFRWAAEPRGLLIRTARPICMTEEEEKTARTQGAQGPEERGGTLFRPDPRFGETPPEVNDAARRVVEAAVEVHRHLGPGYVESVYENALAVELGLRGIPFERQVAFRVAYKGHEVGEGRMDLLVECCLVVELKAVERITDVHLAQALSYLKATGRTLGLLINVNVPVLLRGVKRIVRNHPSIQMEGAPMAPEPRGAQT
jgi:GxxExxY protein